jgi:hypothetical protein
LVYIIIVLKNQKLADSEKKVGFFFVYAGFSPDWKPVVPEKM